MPWILKPEDVVLAAATKRKCECILPHNGLDGALTSVWVGAVWRCDECGKLWQVRWHVSFGDKLSAPKRPTWRRARWWTRWKYRGRA